MRIPGVTFGLAALLITLPGCPSAEPPEGGGGGPTLTAEGQAPLPTRLSGDPLAFGQAYARLPWVTVHLGAGDWGQALRDVTYVQDRIVQLKFSERLVGRPRQAIAELQPATDRLALAVQQREPGALARAADLTAAFTRVAGELAAAGWLASGGGPAAPASPAR